MDLHHDHPAPRPRRLRRRPGRTPAALLRRVGLALAAAFALSAVAVPASAEEDTPLRCTMAVTGKGSDGRLLTGPLSCTSFPITREAGAALDGAAGLRAVTLATHYTGPNYTGSALTITGSGCDGSWLNMPAGWVDVISSTRSYCTVVHYDYFYLGGAVGVTYSPGGNLLTFDNRTNSAEYL